MSRAGKRWSRIWRISAVAFVENGRKTLVELPAPRSCPDERSADRVNREYRERHAAASVKREISKLCLLRPARGRSPKACPLLTRFMLAPSLLFLPDVKLQARELDPALHSIVGLIASEASLCAKAHSAFCKQLIFDDRIA